MKTCRLCGKPIWNFKFLTFNFILQPFEVWNIEIKDRKWKEYEHKKCEIKYPERTLNKRERDKDE